MKRDQLEIAFEHALLAHLFDKGGDISCSHMAEHLADLALEEIAAAIDGDVYQAYLLGCEDECLPEPKTKEEFLKLWSAGV